MAVKYLIRNGMMAAFGAAAVLFLGSLPVSASFAAGIVTSVTVAVAPNNAVNVTGMRYQVGFVTSSAGALAGDGQITITAPAGTVFFNSVRVRDVTTGQAFSEDADVEGNVVIVPTGGFSQIAGGDQVLVTLSNVTNGPKTGASTITVSTSSDTGTASGSYTLIAQHAIPGDATVKVTPNNAVNVTGMRYQVGFTTSSTGALSDFSTITITAPAGTVFFNSVRVQDVTTGQSSAEDASIAGSVVTVPAGGLGDIADGDQVLVTLSNVTNGPKTGAGAITVSTSSDTGIASGSYALVAQHAIPGGATVQVTPTGDIKVAGVTYTVKFTTSVTGTLSDFSTIKIAAPTGTAFLNQVKVEDVTTGQSFAEDASIAGSVVTVPAGGFGEIAGGDQLLVTFGNVTNGPKAGANAITVSTSSDTGTAAASYSLTKDFEITGVVSAQGGTGPAAVPGALVQACGSSSCAPALAPTDSQGRYSLYLPAAGSYTVTALPPTSGAFSVGSESAGPVTVEQGVTTQDLTLPPLSPPPPGITFGGQSGVVPTVSWGSPAALTLQGCKGGAGDVTVESVSTATGAPVLAFGGLTESPPGSGTYTTTVPPLYPSHGTAFVSAQILCSPPTALLPGSGPATGGNLVQISGTGFTKATKVMFGTVPARSFTVESDSAIDAVTPSGHGTVQVRVVTPAGTITSASLARYTYLTVTSVTPARGPAAGGASVTLTGTDFSGVQAVYFGNAAASSVTLNSDTKLTAIAPPGTGTVPVTVLVADGGQSAPGAATFAYGSGSARPAEKSAAPAPPAAVQHREPAVATARAASRGLTPVSPATQVNYVAGAMANHETAGCAGSACAQFTTEADQAASQYAQDVVHGGWSAPDQDSPLPNCVNCLQVPDPPGPVTGPPSPPGGPKVINVPSGSEWHAAETWVFCGTSDIIIAPVSIYCSSAGGQQACVVLLFCFPVHIDPSGTVEDTNGHPVAGATVTLLRSDGQAGPFGAPPSGSPIMEPSVNPETSDSGGAFHWDVFAGYYQITAAKSGCAAPGHPARQVVSTPVFPVPPPKVGIVLTLSCPSEAPPARPKVTSLTSHSGPRTGGEQLDLSGSGFTHSTTVSFGSAKARGVQVLSPTGLIVTVPPGTGTVDVRVTTAGGTSAITSADRFTYQGPPAVVSISPRQGRAASKTTVTITGKGFAVGDEVVFGSAPATSVSVASPGKIVATAPSGSGLVDVRVISADGASPKVAADRYGYLAKPSFTSASSARATKGRKFTFTVKTKGLPIAKLTESGRLPPGVKFTAHANGTATVTGKPAAKGRFKLTITAKNKLGTARQTLTLTVSG